MIIENDQIIPIIELGSQRDPEMLEHLRRRGLTIDVRVTSAEETLLHFFVVGGQVEVVHWLWELGANPNLPDRHGCYPLHSAVLLNNLDMVKALCQMGARLDTKDGTGSTAECLAAGLLRYELFLFMAGASSAHQAMNTMRWDVIERLAQQTDDSGVQKFAEGVLAVWSFEKMKNSEKGKEWESNKNGS